MPIPPGIGILVFMKNKSLTILLAIFIPSVLIFAIQYFTNPDRLSNDFDRQFINFEVLIEKDLKLPSKNMGVAFTDDDAIYFRDFSDPRLLAYTNYKLNHLSFLNLPEKIDHRNKQFSFAKAGQTIIANQIGTNLLYHLTNRRVEKVMKLPGTAFDQFIPISTQSIVSREAFVKNEQPHRRLIRMKGNRIIKHFELKGYTDEFFSNDGLLKYNSKHAWLVYSHFYSGEFICLDTNLNLIYTKNTIDTVRHPVIHIANRKRSDEMQITKSQTQSHPPRVINNNLFLDNDYVYIISELKADNESGANWRRHQVIDVYSIISGRYLYSFYVPKYNREKLRDFVIKDDQIICIFGYHVISYRLITSHKN